MNIVGLKTNPLTGRYCPNSSKESTMLTKLKAFRMFVADYLWAAQAYLRGKVLRQEMYRPRSVPSSIFGDSTVSSFRLPVGTGIMRIGLFMEFCGLRSLMLGETTELLSRSPYRDRAGVPNVWDRDIQRLGDSHLLIFAR